MVKSGEKLEKVGKGGKNREKWIKVTKSGEKLEKCGKTFLKFLDKMAVGGHFGLDDNVSYRTRPRYLDE